MPLQSEYVTTTSYYSADECVRNWNTDQNAFQDNNIWNDNRTSRKLIAKASKNKRIRKTFTSNQIERLQEEFLKREYLCKMDRIEIAKTLNLNERQILTWFQNRRMKKKRESINNTSSNFNKEEYSTKTESTFIDEHNIATLDYYNGQKQCNYHPENYINQYYQNNFNKEEYPTNTGSTFTDEHNIATLDYYNGQEQCNYHPENYINQDYQNNFNEEEYPTNTESTFTDEHNIATLDYYNGQEQCNYQPENYINQDYQNQYYNHYNKYQLPATQLEYSLYYQTFEFPSPASYCT